MNNPGTTPIRLVKLTLLGAAMLIADFAILDALHRMDNHSYHMWKAILSGTVFAGAIALMFVSRYRLSRGIKDDRWREEELEIARQLMNMRWVSWLYAAQLVFALCFLCFAFAFGFHQASALTDYLLPLSFITALKTLLSKRPAARSGTFAHVDWASFKPIHSTHWGEPPATT
jgi:hypothetical protein